MRAVSRQDRVELDEEGSRIHRAGQGVVLVDRADVEPRQGFGGRWRPVADLAVTAPLKLLLQRLGGEFGVTEDLKIDRQEASEGRRLYVELNNLRLRSELTTVGLEPVEARAENQEGVRFTEELGRRGRCERAEQACVVRIVGEHRPGEKAGRQKG